MYRKKGEVVKFDTNNPIGRLRSYMVKQGWWDDDQENLWKEESKKMVCKHFVPVRQLVLERVIFNLIWYKAENGL